MTGNIGRTIRDYDFSYYDVYVFLNNKKLFGTAGGRCYLD